MGEGCARAHVGAGLGADSEEKSDHPRITRIIAKGVRPFAMIRIIRG